MASSIIGQLRVILGLDTAQFEKGLSDSQRQMSRAARSYEQIGSRIQNVGKSLSIGLTLPLVAIGGASLKMAADFESAMNRVEAATGASGRELKALRDQAKAFGADRSVPATAAETASAMEMLAKNGRSVTEILGGATEATLKLSAATGGDLSAAADLATDIMAQFGKSAAELPDLVDKMSGAMVASKLDFDNYRLAIGQAGAVAGNLMPFEQFNAAIAATASSFSSGSDAGTSFKTFIQRLTPQSKQAAEAIDELGLHFWDAQGKLRPVGEIAEQLRVKLGGLSKEAQQSKLTTIFGADAMRTAIGLMQQGAAGIANMQAQIDRVKASDQAAALMKGWAGAATQIKKAFEAASISIGDSGFLTGMTNVALAVASVIQAFAKLPAPVLVAIGTFAGIAAAAGPVVMVIGKLFSTWGMLLGLAPRLAVQLGIIASAETAVGAAGVTGAVGVTRLGTALRFVGGPWGIAIGLIATAIWGVYEASKSASKGVAQQGDATKIAADASAKMNAILAGDPSAGVAKNARDLADARIKAAKAAYAQAAGELALRRAQAATDLGLAQSGYRKVTKERTEVVPGTRQRRTVSYDTLEKIQRLPRVRGGEPMQPQNVAIRDAQGQLDEATRAQAQLTATFNSTVAQANAAVASLGGGGGSGGGSAGGGGGGKKTTGHHGGTGRSPEELAERREELALQAQVDAAQEKGDDAAAQALRDRLDLTRQIRAYEDAGLAKAAATVAAQRDMAAIQKARAEHAAAEVARSQQDLDINVAQISGDQRLIEKLERQRDIQERIAFYRAHNYDLARATAQAEADQLRVDQARAAVRAQWFAQDARDRAIHLAELRGDTEAQVRALKVQSDVIARAEELQRQKDLSPEDARAQALTEAMEEEQARQQGIFRDTIKGGFRAALDGSLGSWVKDWWKDRVAKGMEEALNSLSDLLASIFSRIGRGSAGGGGSGIGGFISSVVGSIFGGGKAGVTPVDMSGWGNAGSAAIDTGLTKLPGFKTGGSFKVGGMAGVDRNLVAFRATAGEIVNVSRKGQDGGPQGQVNISMPMTFSGAMDLATKAEAVRFAEAARQAAIQGVMEAQRRRG